MTQAVVTLCDHNYFPGLLKLHESISTSHPCELLCYDAGLLPSERAQAEALPGLRVLDLPDDPLVHAITIATVDCPPLAKQGKRIWPLWICPLLIRSAPASDVVWLDCDLVVLRGLDEIFAMLEDGPVFTPENKAPDVTANKPALYDHLPIERSFDPALPVVNGGVSAWRPARDHAVLAAYLRPVVEAAASPAVRDAISWHDQGALIWAIQMLGLEERVLTSTMWNLSVENAGVPDEVLRWDANLLPRLRTALPDVRILHWNGHRSPWLAQQAGPSLLAP